LLNNSIQVELSSPASPAFSPRKRKKIEIKRKKDEENGEKGRQGLIRVPPNLCFSLS